MSDIIAEIFGYLVLAVAIGLAGWEVYVYRYPGDDVEWLQTPHRLRRRLIMSMLLLCVGLLILSESRGFLELDNLRDLVIYVTSLTSMALLLLVLSIRDLGEMARNAEKHAIEDLQSALEKQTNSSEQPPETAE